MTSFIAYTIVYDSSSPNYNIDYDYEYDRCNVRNWMIAEIVIPNITIDPNKYIYNFIYDKIKINWIKDIRNRIYITNNSSSINFIHFIAYKNYKEAYDLLIHYHIMYKEIHNIDFSSVIKIYQYSWTPEMYIPWITYYQCNGRINGEYITYSLDGIVTSIMYYKDGEKIYFN